MCYHPTIENLIFAASRQGAYISYDNGVSFNSLNAPNMDNEFQTVHWDFYQIMVLDDKFYGIATHRHSQQFYMVKCNISNINMQNETITTNWVYGAEGDFIDPDKTLVGAQFSNIALGRFYLFLKQADNSDGDTGLFRFVYKSHDYGDNYSLLPNVSGGGDTSSNVDGDINNGKCELIASTIDPNVLYNGVIYRVRRWNDTTGVNTIVNSAPSNNGHHNDYRSSHLLTINGKDRIIFGNDGGIAIVRDGLAASPVIASLNGDLSINLLHAFDIHEETGRTLFAFQDHSMVYRDHGNIYSSRFLHEGSFAMIQQHYPDGIVGQTGYPIGRIQDKSEVPHGIVDGSLTPAYLGAYQCHYRHFPERFAAGLSNGTVALNRGANISEYSEIPFFINYHGTDSAKGSKIGDVAICQRKPEFIYAARNGGGSHTEEYLVKSINDADPNDPNTWISLSSSLVSLPIYSDPLPLQNLVAWKGIRSIAVDHFDENLVYCGINKVYTHHTDTIMDEVFRVIKSTTGGEPNPNFPNNAAWIDYSEGLPAFPVERLLTVESDNELIFCATSVGIYYRTKTMSQWECFSKNLPFTEITGLKYDYCNNVLYASTYGRGLWKTQVNIPIVNTYSEIIDEDQTWDENRTVYTPITVEAGNTLTITAVIRMATGTNIIVEPGATLIVDGGTLTSSCNDLWQGIEVWGNHNLPQNAANQGRLIVKNNALIENAENAVTVWKPGDWATTGGIVQATNSTFRNNKRSIEFLAYQNLQTNGYIAPNLSYFKNCTFETNDDILLSDTQGNQNMFTMYKVNGVGIFGCDFIYNRTVSAYTDLKGAIYTSDANFRVGNSCSSPFLPVGEPCPAANTKRSTFTGFNQAIHVTSATWNVGPEIRDAVFSENMVGINFDAVTAPAAIFNEFTVGNNQFPPFIGDNPSHHLGIKVNNCDEYIVEENEFTGSDIYDWTTHGVYTYDHTYSGNSNEIYKNEYTGVSSATIAAGNHANPDDNDSFIGLRFICNENENNINDFELRPWSLNEPSEISNYQNGGGSNIPAGNTFSSSTTGDNVFTHLDFYSNASYTYIMNIADTDPDENEVYITPPGTITLIPLNFQNNCVTNYPVVGGELNPGLTYGKMKSDRDAYHNLYYPYLQLIDAGNTQGMISEIELSWPNDAWDLHAELMTRSPFNSETVLIAAANKNVLTHGMLLEILLANPDALRSGNVIRQVGEFISNPLPQYMIDILIEASRDPSTVRSGMEKNLSNLHLEMIRTHKRISHQLMNDSVVGFHPDTLIKYFSSVRSLTGRYQQIYAYSGLHRYAHAHAVLDSISLYYKLSNEQISELNNTEDFIEFLEAIHSDGRNIAQLTASEITALMLISEVKPGGAAAERAENILCFFYDRCADDFGAPKNNGVKLKKPRTTKETLEEALNVVKVAPNPADLYIEFEYQVFKSTKENVLRILDVQGKPIMSWNLGFQQGIKVLDTRKIPNGIYFYELLQDGSKLKGGKFIIQH